MKTARERTLFDHLATWTLALFLGLMGLPMVITIALAPFQQPGGVPGPLLPAGLGLTYGAFATLRDEYGFPRAWRPSLTQGFVIAWYGGWTALIVLGMVRELIEGGLGLVGKWLGGDIAAWFVLVGLPWILASLHDRRRRGVTGWVDSS
jgi:hypothetical protein